MSPCCHSFLSHPIQKKMIPEYASDRSLQLLSELFFSIYLNKAVIFHPCNGNTVWTCKSVISSGYLSGNEFSFFFKHVWIHFVGNTPQKFCENQVPWSLRRFTFSSFHSFRTTGFFPSKVEENTECFKYMIRTKRYDSFG